MSLGQTTKLLVIVGPTGAGKSALAMHLARKIGGEILSADSQQVYRGMDIGTAKASEAERSEIPHHLLDVVDPDQEMCAASFVELADAAIADILHRDRVPIVVGGTMLYIRALLEGLFEGPAADMELRATLEAQSKSEGPGTLWKLLQAVDEESAERIHATDIRRLIRAIEVHTLSGIALSEHHRRHRAQPPRYLAQRIGITAEREQLYKRIDARVLSMMDAGLLDEVRALQDKGYGVSLRSQQAIGYVELHRHLQGEMSLEEAVTLIQRNSRRYARRQMSWYRGDSSVTWLTQVAEVDGLTIDGLRLMA
ncbi:MAG: tRNA (adenosine(37)-N6)-dimethylallyltransferase MiaA [Kofleriaceae bacterium]|nr:tRNA (adenosine(37)-N6)-dimethylallyltransferase MiaA [Kofleriaceae bacterium]